MAASICFAPSLSSCDRIPISFEPSQRLKCRQAHLCKSKAVSSDGLEPTISHTGGTIGSRRKFVEFSGSLLVATMAMTMSTKAAQEAGEEAIEASSCELTFAPSGLGYCDLVVGSGLEPPQGELINIHYIGRFEDGKIFDSSYKRGRPLTLRIGVGKVIKGWDQGILGGDGVPPMLVGGKRKLRVPPQLAYGVGPAGCYGEMKKHPYISRMQEARKGFTSYSCTTHNYFYSRMQEVLAYRKSMKK